MSAAATYLSIADLARRLNVPRHRVVWVVAFYSVPCAVQVGECKGYTEEAVGLVRGHLERIESARLATI